MSYIDMGKIDDYICHSGRSISLPKLRDVLDKAIYQVDCDKEIKRKVYSQCLLGILASVDPNYEKIIKESEVLLN